MYEKYKGMLSVEDRGYQGEVSTPLKLVNEMLDKLPEEVFINKSTTFLDPGFGNGTFLIEIVKRLRKQGHSMENIQERVYGCEISHRLYNKVTKLFSNYNFRKLYKEDFLTKDFNNMKFDVVIGNPPYNTPKELNKRSEKLWPKFIESSYKLTKPGGYTCLVTPDSWLAGTKNIRKASYGVMDLFKEATLKEVIYGVKFPGVSVNCTVTVLEKVKTKNSTIFSKYGETVSDEYNIHTLPIIPSDLNKNKINILNKVLNKDTPTILPGTGLQTGVRNLGEDEPTQEKNVKVVVRGGEGGVVNYAYFDKDYNEKYTNIKKVVIPVSGAEKFMPFIDVNNTPICINSYVVKIEQEEATYENIKSFYFSKLIRFLIEAYRTSGFIQIPIVKKLPGIDLGRKWTDAEIYSYFRFNDEEINLVESIIK